MVRSGRISRGGYLYNDVARQLRKRIEDRVYTPGGKLPSMNELCSSFGVSAITVRNALRELAQQGLISGHQGLGVFVKERGQIHRVLAGSPQRSIGDEIARAGFRAPLAQPLRPAFRANRVAWRAAVELRRNTNAGLGPRGGRRVCAAMRH